MGRFLDPTPDRSDLFNLRPPFMEVRQEFGRGLANSIGTTVRWGTCQHRSSGCHVCPCVGHKQHSFLQQPTGIYLLDRLGTLRYTFRVMRFMELQLRPAADIRTMMFAVRCCPTAIGSYRTGISLWRLRCRWL